MTNGQDALVEVVLSKLDTMNIGEMLQTARDLPKSSKAYAPLDNTIAKYISEHLSDMSFGAKFKLYSKIPAKLRANTALENSILENLLKNLPNGIMAPEVFEIIAKIDNAVQKYTTEALKEFNGLDSKEISKLWFQIPTESEVIGIIKRTIRKEISTMNFKRLYDLKGYKNVNVEVKYYINETLREQAKIMLEGCLATMTKTHIKTVDFESKEYNDILWAIKELDNRTNKKLFEQSES